MKSLGHLTATTSLRKSKISNLQAGIENYLSKMHLSHYFFHWSHPNHHNLQVLIQKFFRTSNYIIKQHTRKILIVVQL